MYEMLDERCAAMPWDQVDAVVFDVGNVLIPFQPGQILETLFPGDAGLQARLTERVFRSPYWAMLDHGLLTYDEAERMMAAGETALRPAIRRILEDWVRDCGTVAEGVAALKTVKARGKRAYVLSNFHREAFAAVEAQHGFFRLMDGKIISSHVKLLKPDPAIYRCLTDTFGLAPERTLFIDDTPMNVEAALACGWQGLCYARPGQLARFFI